MGSHAVRSGERHRENSANRDRGERRVGVADGPKPPSRREMRKHARKESNPQPADLEAAVGAPAESV